EAVETAIKAVRNWAYTVKGVPADQAEILVFENNFHGRTTTIVGFSSEPTYREGFGPYAPGFRLLPYGDAAAVERALEENGPRVAAVLVEPIQGEAGIIIPPQGFLARLRELTAKHRALLVTDEIQSGLGRTGKLFAYQHEGIRPDVVIVGKALSGGFYPVSGILADDAVMSVWKRGQHGSTFGGNPLAAAVASAALRVLVEEKMIENAAALGPYFLDRLRRIDSRHVKEVRGKGLWIGIELHREAGGARRFCEALQTEGLLCKETHEHVIRIAPPLVIKREQIDWALERLERVLTTL
ncbi:MAG: ornithine--oxo-acid transaminase, partial [Acidobacteria bacterium]|nr:ornithine--oxo-acid transaminase [Acidobacteriota bacterium]